ncbi:hypothetical protein WN51_08943 [Melipona quadrifasciata]|uniref:Uncharacterized protein n=1 Tax=Melipona quadrifasciata TaxID=166423 RepID=A0A0N0BBD4_9HYME|nr:hypothetical protein WN51_08943 [Melipona quadrifasciata]
MDLSHDRSLNTSVPCAMLPDRAEARRDSETFAGRASAEKLHESFAKTDVIVHDGG